MIEELEQLRKAESPRQIERSRMPARLAAGRDRWKGLVLQADELWSKIVKAEHPICQRCGLRPAVAAHHLRGRTKWPTRWRPENGAALCNGCHRLVHADGEENRALGIRLLGSVERWESLVVQSNLSGVKTDPKWWIVILRAS